MATMNAYGIAGNVSRREKWEAHDVVPMDVGHEEIINLRLLRSMLRQDLLAEAAQSRAHIAESVMIAADYFHARSIAAVTTAQGKFQLRIDKALERRVVGEFAAVGSEQSAFNFVADHRSVTHCRQRAASPPKTDAHGDSPFLDLCHLSRAAQTTRRMKNQRQHVAFTIAPIACLID